MIFVVSSSALDFCNTRFSSHKAEFAGFALQKVAAEQNAVASRPVNRKLLTPGVSQWFVSKLKAL
ncbi:MAG: hypothetical protein ACREEJ_02115 [Ensifer adhaerens]